MQKMKPTYKQIAEDFRLWGEYVDPSGLDSEADFDTLSIEDKISMEVRMFGPEEDTE